MKTSSWEIIIAGFIFVGLGIYLIEQNSSTSKAPTPPDSISFNLDGKNLRVIELKGLKNLQNLENLENLRNLENLKNLTNFLPAEIRFEFEKEIDEVMQEFDQESVDVVLNSDEGTISVNRKLSAESGNWTAVSPGIFAYIKEFNASELNEAELKLPFGSIEVIGSNDPQAKLTVQASGQVSTKEDLRSKLSTQSDINSEQVVFEIRTRDSQSKDHNIQLQATLALPNDVRVYALTNAGHISSKDINGNQHYKTLGGHIVLEALTGTLTAETGGGHITVSDSEGNLTLNSKGGNIRAQDSNGTLVMKTSGGNLQAYDFGGSIQASTNGGNIELRLVGLTGNSNASTGAGSISIWFPKTGNAGFNLSGSSIEIDSDLNFKGSQSSGSASGSVGNGNHTLTAKTNYGKVILKSVD
ncbi:MAG: DUF4097 family beta strand repeat-containing protein [Gracilimonas sp.]